MKRFYLLIFIASFGLACRGVAESRALPKPIRPGFIIEIARKDFTGLTKSERVETQEEFYREYADGFLRGFSSPGAGIAWTSKKGGNYRGFYAGQKYLKAHPESLARVFKAYGYEEIDVVGRWEAGAEKSALYVDGKDVDSPWWLSQIFDVLPHTVSNEITIGRPIARLQLNGFLSPIGQYGHMGSYEREMFITSVVVKEAMQPLETKAKSAR